jgi:predicted nucleotidyltransferase
VPLYVGLATMDEKIKSLINQIKAHLIKLYGDKITKIVLYGSYVRGEASKDSDIDLLVLVDSSLNPFEVRESLSDLLFDILLEKGELISVIAIPENLFENYNSPFILNVRKEGLVA